MEIAEADTLVLDAELTCLCSPPPSLYRRWPQCKRVRRMGGGGFFRYYCTVGVDCTVRHYVCRFSVLPYVLVVPRLGSCVVEALRLGVVGKHPAMSCTYRVHEGYCRSCTIYHCGSHLDVCRTNQITTLKGWNCLFVLPRQQENPQWVYVL